MPPRSPRTLNQIHWFVENSERPRAIIPSDHRGARMTPSTRYPKASETIPATMPASSTRPMLIFPMRSPYPFVMVKHIENKCLQDSSQWRYRGTAQVYPHRGRWRKAFFRNLEAGKSPEANPTRFGAVVFFWRQRFSPSAKDFST